MKRILVLAVLSACSVAAIAHQPEDRATEYRQGLMHVIGWNFGPLGAMVKGKHAFDATEFSLRADRIAVLSEMVLEGFPKAPPKGVNTDAKADIWASFDDFTAKAKDFAKEANALGSVAKAKDEAKDKEQFKKVAAACKACHDKYKNDD